MKSALRFAGASLPVFCVVALSACDSAYSAEGVVVRELDGVTIVDNRRPEWPEGEGWTVDPVPLFVLDDASQVTDVAVLNDGTIAVLDAMEFHVLLYDSTGQLAATVGQEGDGPGEFRSPSAVTPYMGDSLAVFDARLGRISIFSLPGQFQRSVPVRIASSRIQFVGTMADGAFVLRAGDFNADQGTWRQPSTFFSISSDGEELDTLFVVDGEEFFGSTLEGGPIYGPRPFGRMTVAAATGQTLAMNIGDDCALEIYDADGGRLMVVDSPCDARKISDDAVTAFQQNRMAQVTVEATRERYSQIYGANRIPFADIAPAYGELLMDPSGNIWAEGYLLPGDTVRTWSLFQRDGRLLGSVEVGADFEIGAVAAGRVVGVNMDGFQVGRVQAHTLVKATNVAGNTLVAEGNQPSP